jgi:predicted CopG family antitoxin
MTKTSKEKMRQIVISEQNYSLLKGLGSTGDSFNDALSELIKRAGLKQ